MNNNELIKYHTYDNELLAQLEWSIINEKIAQGVNGIEWLVMSIKTDQSTIDNHHIWFKKIGRLKASPNQVTIDNFALNPNYFEDEHGMNWWMSFDHAIYHLQSLKERDYDAYFKLLMQYEEARQLKEDERT